MLVDIWIDVFLFLLITSIVTNVFNGAQQFVVKWYQQKPRNFVLKK
jgi:hypothetical protein